MPGPGLVIVIHIIGYPLLYTKSFLTALDAQAASIV